MLAHPPEYWSTYSSNSQGTDEFRKLRVAESTMSSVQVRLLLSRRLLLYFVLVFFLLWLLVVRFVGHVVWRLWCQSGFISSLSVVLLIHRR